MSERSVVKDSWPKDIDVGGDMITHVLLKLFLPPTETCKPDKKFSFFPPCLLSLVVVQSSIFRSRHNPESLAVRVS